jgi:hypothetical protein
MSASKSKKYFILMADVAKSSESNGDKVISDLKKLVRNVGKENENLFLSPMTITLGDEFQSVLRSLPGVIDILFSLEEATVSLGIEIKMRYVINYGEIDTPVNPEYAHEMLGKGLTEARQLLSKLKDTENRFQFNDSISSFEFLNSGFILLSSIVDDWKHKDFPVISEFLKEKDYKDVADTLGKDRGYIWRKERSLKIKPYFASKYIIKSFIG